MRPSRPRLPRSGCTPRAGRSRSRRRTRSSGGRRRRSPSWASGRGDLVLATARNTPEYLFAWLGAAYAGAIIVAVNPRAGENELAGLVRQVRPRLVVTDATAPVTVRESGGATIDVAALYSRPAGHRDAAAAGPRRSGGAHPDVGHDRAVEARDADPPGLRDGRRGVPVVDGARPRRPADDVAAALPHQRARVLGARLGRARGRASCCCRGSRRARSSTRPGGTARRSSTRSARCSRSSCASRSATTMPTRRFASVTPALRRPEARNSRSRSGSAFESSAATRCRSRRTA